MNNYQSISEVLKQIPARFNFEIPEYKNYRTRISEHEENEDVPDHGAVDSDVDFSGLLVGIEYTDISGTITRRKITCRELQKTAVGQWLILAYCHERRAARHFRVDRISEVVALSTGEVFDSGFEFLKSLAKDGVISDKYSDEMPEYKDHKKVQNYLSPAIRILVYIARCDGHFHNEELQVIARFIDDMRPAQEYDYNLDAILRYAARQYPESGDYSKCIERIYGDDSWCEKLRAPLLKYIPKLIYADGVLDNSEFELACEMEAIAVDKENKRKAAVFSEFFPDIPCHPVTIDEILSDEWE